MPNSYGAQQSAARRVMLALALAVAVSLPGGALPAGASGPATIYVDKAGCGGLTPCYTGIQAAIDAASSGDTILVLPGNYDETASGRYLYDGSGPYQFGLFIGTGKDGITIQGIDASGNAITDAANVAAVVTTNATNSFGSSGIFVEADDVTIAGIEIGPNLPSDNKTIEVIGNGFTLRGCEVDVPGAGGSVYFNDWRYDSVAATSYVERYTVEGNVLLHGTSVDVSSGVGVTGDVSGRVISGNTFAADPGDDWALVSFNGTVPSVGWFLYPVGGAAITGNTFSGSTQYIRTRGQVAEDQFEWAQYWNDNTFDHAAIVWADSGPSVRAYSYLSGGALMENCRRIGASIQGEIDHAQSGDTVQAKAGTYAENVTLPPTVSGLSLIGAGRDVTTIEAATAGYTLLLTSPDSLVEGFTIAPGANPDGIGISWGYQGSDSTVRDCRIRGYITGIYMGAGTDNATISDNIITGNANGILFETATDSVITGNHVVDNNRGDSYWSAQGLPASAGIRVLTDAYYAGSGNVVTGNWITGSAAGVDNNSTLPFAAECNWWGSIAGPGQGTANPAVGNVDYTPWGNETLDGCFVGALVLTPSTASTHVGGQVVLDVLVNGARDLAGFDLSITYDATKLRALGVSVSDPTLFDWSSGWLDPLNSMGSGHVDWAATLNAGGIPANGNVPIMRITFEALEATSGSAVSIADGYLLSDSSGLKLLPSGVSGAVVTIDPVWQVSGAVLLQGRGDHSGTIVNLSTVGAVTTGSVGSYAFTVVPGTYNMSMERVGYLDAWRNGVVVSGNVSLSTVTLLFGDMNDDDKVNIQDMAFIAYRFGASTGGARWDARADMNANGIVNIYDLTAAAGNYSKSSASF